MVFLITVILISAYQRLLLYESAYGFSRLRTYTHIFMIWIGLLLFAMVVLEITNRQRAFAFATLLTCLGFGLTLNFLNIDGFIVERNIARAEAGAELDANYLYQLSNDAIPVMFRAYNTTNNPTIRNKLGAILACWKTVKFSEQPVKDWRAYSWSESHAFSLFVTYEQQLIPYSVKPGNDGDTLVRVNGIEVSCNSIQ
jgi:hypothetical protein